MQFDAWRDGDPPEKARAEVDSHLDQCVACRRWFDAAVQLGNDLELLGVTADLMCRSKVDGLEKDRLPTTRPAWGRLSGLARQTRVAAAILFLCSVTWLMTARREPDLSTNSLPSTHAIDPVQPRRPQPKTATVVSLSGDDARWVAPIPSDNPRIHIVWVYGDPAPQPQFEQFNDPPSKSN